MSFAARSRQPGASQAVRSVTIPAPMGGVNAVDSAAALPPGDCLWAYNLVASEYGLRTRLGYREWLTGLTGALANDVRGILTFKGSAKSGTNDRVFACTSTGIFDVTTSYSAWQGLTDYEVGDVVLNDTGKIYTCVTAGTSDSTPGPTGTGSGIADDTAEWDYTGTILELTFASSANDAGYGVAHGFVNSSGAHFLLYCDEENGYHVYTESTDTWAKIAMGGGGSEISGVDPASFRYVHVFKSRVCFATADSQSFYYLAAGSLYGAATVFPLQAQFKSGGDAVGLWSWTFDGGAGMDDALVVISRGGDVAIYTGINPADSAFALRGVYNVAAIPPGRDIAYSVGGELWIVTQNGVRSTSELVSGGADVTRWPTAKIANTFNALMQTRSTLKRWKMRVHPEENALVLTVPEADGVACNQWVLSLARKSWTPYRDLPIYSCEVHAGKFYFGTTDGKVCIHDGTIDAVALDDPDEYEQIEWSMLTSYSNLGRGTFKQVQTILPILLGQSANPTVESTAKYDFDLVEPGAPSVVASAEASAWDVGEWDEAVWGGDFTPSMKLAGATGAGRYVAIAVRGNATARTTLVGIELTFTEGGLL